MTRRPSARSLSPQVQASDPRASVFVSANAGSGKTSTLVARVARLLLSGAEPRAILCMTYTKAAAAEMQRRLFDRLGAWAVMKDEPLTAALAGIDEPGGDLGRARALFARALETPGGLKIQTIHAFCEKLLRRFPLEAGISPGFTVLEDAAAARVSARARETVADIAMARPESSVARAYDHFAVALDFDAFNRMFADFEANRRRIDAWIRACEAGEGYAAHVWRSCGFAAPTSAAAIGAEAVSRIRWGAWRRAAVGLARGGGKSDATLAAAMRAVGEGAPFEDVEAIFITLKGEARDKLGTLSVDADTRAWMAGEQARCVGVRASRLAADVADDTVHALTLASAYIEAYEGRKESRRALDFGDLIERTHDLLTRKADAAWVLYKLDGGLEHVLLDEAQDTAPGQWDILRMLTGDFFSGAGVSSDRRTVFAVGDEKQSIFSFQGAEPERLGLETQSFRAAVSAGGGRFSSVRLIESYRSAPEILTFVDTVFAAPGALAGVCPATSAAGGNVVAFPRLTHKAWRSDRGCVELWPVEQGETADEVEAWPATDREPARSAGRDLAVRIARAVVAMVRRGDGVLDKTTGAPRPCRFGDVLILVRRRNPLFHEIIRALKREGAPVGGADRLKLSEHGVFQDLMGLAMFALFPDDDLTLAALLRGPFCDVDESGLFDLAHARRGSLSAELTRRAGEREAWRAARAMLDWARGEAGRLTPFDFFNRALSRLDDAGRSMRQRILTRMGAEAQDALDAFLAQALQAESMDVRDLETFVAVMASTDLVIKREADEALGRGGGEVRVMTVHGAKGLEAPIVILPDTTSRADDQGGHLIETGDGGFVWAPRKADDCPVSAAARAWRLGAVERESARLLYVALTRARDRLIVAGVKSQEHRFERSWREYVETAFGELEAHPFALEGGGEGRRYGPDPVP
ncbi:MAG: double-strand break repair helicase AddA, partial [Caulobacteraceae bacterium]